MKLSTIVAIGKNYEIGLVNKLLWHISEDLKNFKRLTNGHHIIMGRKTYESIGFPLPNRTSVVLSKNGFEADDVFTCKDLDEAIKLCQDRGEDEAFIIGGAQIYSDSYLKSDKLYLTRVDFVGEADTYFPEIDMNQWEILEEVCHEASDLAPAWVFQELRRVN